MDYILSICEKLGVSPTLQLKKPIRGLKGFNTYELIDSLIKGGSILKAAHLLGYTDNPVKQAVRTALQPHFPSRSREFTNPGMGSDLWRNALLGSIHRRWCNSCNSIKSLPEFPPPRINSGVSSYECKACAVARSKLHKHYIHERTPEWAELDLIADFYSKCPIGYEVDHEIPLRGKLVSGLHVLSNLRYLSKEANRQKSNKFMIE